MKKCFSIQSKEIRKALGMSQRQMAERMGITQSSYARLESSEARKAITLKSLEKIAKVWEADLIYQIVKKDSE